MDGMEESRNHVETLISSTDPKTLEKTLDSLLNLSKTTHGRSNLSSSSAKPLIPHLLRLLASPQNPNLLFLTLKTLRNLCAGEFSNQTSFIRSNGVDILHSALTTSILESPPSDGPDATRIGLQLLANVVLAGEEHCRGVWKGLFPSGFADLGRVRRFEVCDPLCRVLYVCCEESEERFGELCGDRGMKIVVEIVRTASAAGFQEDWLPLLVSRICFKEQYFFQLFFELNPPDSSKNSSSVNCGDTLFTTEQAFLLKLLSEILNQQLDDILYSKGFALAVFEILKKASGAVEASARDHSGLPTGCASIDVIGYSLNILRDICAHESPKDQSISSSLGMLGGPETEASMSLCIVDSLICSGLVTLLLCSLRELEPPEIIRKSISHEENRGKVCPYLGYRRDIVAVIGNCAFRRKQVQDEIREQNGILLIMQQCVVDKDNPFLREWGIWTIRNLLEGNAENQKRVAELELQGSVNTPEVSSVGLRVEIDPKSQRPKLVNVS
ncbi:hypothetical protein AAC387_Pa02g0105 [Persea americana]